jgi:hypothetical protein
MYKKVLSFCPSMSFGKMTMNIRMISLAMSTFFNISLKYFLFSYKSKA